MYFLHWLHCVVKTSATVSAGYSTEPRGRCSERGLEGWSETTECGSIEHQRVLDAAICVHLVNVLSDESIRLASESLFLEHQTEKRQRRREELVN